MLKGKKRPSQTSGFFMKIFFFISLFFLISNCSFDLVDDHHGVFFLDKKEKKIIVQSSNKNDVIEIFGHPHSKSISDENEWFYIERILIKGEYHKLGQHVLKTNNVLILKFDKFGILNSKEIIDKNKKKDIVFSKKETTNDIGQKSFVERFLSSVRSKMYRKK